MKFKEKIKIMLHNNGKSWLLLSLAISFMICIFAPLEAYFANKSEFWFEINNIFPLILVVFVIVFVILLLISVFLQKIKTSYHVYGFIFCFMLYFYFQGNYVPRNYGVLNGVDIVWESYIAYAIISIVLLAISVVAGILVCIKLKEKIYEVGKVVCSILILLQIVTLVTLFVQNMVLEKSDTSNKIVTTKDMFSLSKDKNVVVFVLDTFDSFVMQDMLANEEGEVYRELFEGFTYYPNTLGAYPTTKGALPQILTGEWYENDVPYTEYVSNAYENNEIYSILEKYDYSVGVYTELMFLNQQNGMYVNVHNGKYDISNKLSFTQRLYSLVAFNYLPHQLKKYFYTTSEDFTEMRKTSTEYKVYSSNVQKFYETILTDGISLNSNKKSFRFYHLQGIHAPYTFDKNLISDENIEYDVYDEAAGNFSMLETYFKELKKEGIWDNTTIIIMADHGYTGLNQNPLFMIKNSKEDHEFAISNKEMSYAYWRDILIALVKGDMVSEETIDVFAQSNPKRRYMYYSWDNSWDKKYLPKIIGYVSIGNAREYDNMIPTGEIFEPEVGVVKIPYQIGKELSFGKGDTAREYCLNGFSINEGNFTWTDGKDAAMLFITDGVDADLQLSMAYSTYSESQRVRIYVNENIVADYVAKGAEERSFLIPKEYVKEGEIYLRYEFPDAVSPRLEGINADGRMLALAMSNLTISVADENTYKKIEEQDTKYLLNTELSFGKEHNTAGKYILQGFGNVEESFTWTDGKRAEMLFNIDEIDRTLEVEMSYFTRLDSQHVIVLANGNMVEEYDASGSETKSIIIPSEYVTNGELYITLELPEAISGKETGENEDTRELALAMTSMIIKTVAVNDYELGTELSFNDEDTARKYILSGFDGNEEYFTWTNGHEAELLFDVGEQNTDLALEMSYFTRLDSQYVTVSVNGKVVEEYEASGDEIKSIIIPSEYIENGELYITLELPNAISGKETGENEDTRKLALAMKTLKISALE